MDRLRELNARHSWHGKICKNETDLNSAGDKAKRLLSTCGCSSLVSESFNHSDGGSEDPIIVIDNQDDRIRLGLRMQLGVNRFLSAIFLNKFNAGHEDLYRGAQADAGVNHHVAA